MTSVGARVWCIRNTDDTTVYAYGFGTYQGDHLLPGEPSGYMLALATETIRKSDAKSPLIDPAKYYGQKVQAGELTQEDADLRIAEVREKERVYRARPVAERARELAESSSRNPRILLDTGHIVWGCQCWWGEAADEADTRRWVMGRTVVLVPAPDETPSREVTS